MNFIKQPDGSYIEASGISGKVVDETKDLYILVTGAPPVKECEDYFLESECTAAGCYWYSNACHKMPPGVTCSDYATESTCTAAGCYWYDGACHSEPKVVPPPEELPWIPIAIAIGGIIVTIGVFLAVKR